MTITGLQGKAQELWELLEPILADMSYELVDLEYAFTPAHTHGSVLRLFIDRLGHDRKVTIKDCEQASRSLDLLLDEQAIIDHGYTLEVSSPGMERRIRKPEDFLRFKGREVNVELRDKIDGRRKIKGTVENVDDETVTLSMGKEEDFSFSLSTLRRAHLVVDFQKALRGKR